MRAETANRRLHKQSWLLAWVCLGLLGGWWCMSEVRAQDGAAGGSGSTPAARPPAAENAADDSTTPRSPAKPPTQDGVKIELDIHYLLMSPEIFAPHTDDGIWRVPGPLLQIPFKVVSVSEPTEFKSTTLKVRGGRFIAYRLFERDEQAAEGRVAREMNVSNQAAEFPMINRAFTLQDASTVKMKMDRVIPGASTMASQHPYYFLLNPRALQERQPKPPARTRNAGEDAFAAAQRIAAESAAFRNATDEHRRMQQEVRALPTEFEFKTPRRIWAVFAMQPTARELTIEGPGFEPWTIQLDELHAMRKCARTTIGVDTAPAARAPTVGFGRSAQPANNLPGETNDQINKMNALVKDKHAYSFRIAAFTLTMAQLTKYATPNDALFQLHQAIIQGSDPTASQVIMKQVATTFPPTTATAQLVKMGASILTPEDRRNALRTSIQSASDPRDAIAQTQRDLMDPNGAEPGEVLRVLLESVGDRKEMAQMIPLRLRLLELPDERREKAIAAVIELAGADAVAANLLNQQLLGAVDPRLVALTLELLVNAEQEGLSLRPVMNSAVSTLFGRAASAASGSTAARRPAVSQRVRPKISSRIVVNSISHNLFKALRSGDLRIRALAWQSLDFFTIQPALNPSELDPANLLVDLAVEQNPTPPQVVEIISRQEDSERATKGLVQLVFRATGDASSRATRLLVGSGRPIPEALQMMSFGERQGFAVRVYQNMTGTEPLVTALMRERVDTSPTLKWFGSQLSLGKVPEPAQWAESVASEDKLLELSSSADPELRLGAVAALVLAAGGEESKAISLRDQIQQMPEVNLPNLRALWVPAKQKIFAARVQKASGAYQLSFRVSETRTTFRPRGTTGSATTTTTQETLLAIGKVQLQSDGQAVRFANQNVNMALPGDAMAIRIANIGELKNFPNEELGRLPLEQSKVALDLLPQPDGSWRGTVALSDGRRLDMILVPANDQQPAPAAS